MLAVFLPLVSLITEGHLEFRIFSQNFENFEIALREVSGPLGEKNYDKDLTINNLTTSTLLATLALYSKESWHVITKSIRIGDKIFDAVTKI
jgi:hypothetical protein